MELVAIVINVHTDLLATLALVSVRRNAPDARVVLVNCEPPAASRAYFARLANEWDFTVVDEPVRPHGRALDHLFRNERSDLTLLLDSDAELLNPELVPRYRRCFENEKVFGAGFIHGPGWLGEAQGHGEKVGYYQERPWLPFVILRTTMVQEALDAGYSFMDFTLYNDIYFSPRLSRLLASRFPGVSPHSARFAQLPKWLTARWAKQPWEHVAWLRRDFYGQRPNYVYYDTGAGIYQYCKYEREWIFVGVDARLHEPDVAHYHGVTRHALSGNPRNATTLVSVAEIASRRLLEYGIEASKLAAFTELDLT